MNKNTVNKMIIINPSMIEKLAFRKVNLRFQRIVRLLMFVLSSENDDDTGGTYHQALSEVNKFRLEFLVKYKNKLKEFFHSRPTYQKIAHPLL